MSIPDSATKTNITEKSQVLRSELKEWEKSFAASHDNQKAGRDDIKQHPEIASKYKEYTRLRNLLAHKSPSSKKRKIPPPQPPASSSTETPQKRSKHTHPLHPSDLDPYDTPHSAQRTPSVSRTCIGPTPQRDGLVLGLFDLLSPSSGSKTTPSKKGLFLQPVTGNPHATPSKPRRNSQGTSADIDGEEAPPSHGKHSKTPPSLSKRIYLSSFLTPSARRVAEQRTPGSRGGVSKLRFGDTPDFLRRNSQRTQDFNLEDSRNEADGEFTWSPVKVRLPAKPAGKGLSALVRGLRKMEEDKLDEEMELMRELEMETQGASHDPREDRKRGGMSPIIEEPPTIIVGDSQLEMPLGADGEEEDGSGSEDLSLEGKTRDGRPLKVWKKKGQKRSTRRVAMKPNAGKWKPEPEWKGGAESEDDELLAVTETQGAGGDEEHIVVGELSGEQGKEGLEVPKEKGKNKKSAGEAIKKAAKKISATAHANFRSLKIKNKQSKGKGGGRFRRKR